MKRLIPGVVFVACMTAFAAQASTVNLMTFAERASLYGKTIIGEEAIGLDGDASVTGHVVNLLSFEWRLIDTNAGGGFAYLQTMIGQTTSNIVLQAVGGPEFGTTRTYTFATPYTGSLVIGMGSGNRELPALLLVDKFVVNSIAAVPEPETVAMLFGGLGLMGFMARNRIGSRRPSKTNKARLQMRMAG
jgi:hypothetical protein